MNRIHLKRKFKLSKIKPINLIAIFIVAILVGIYFIFGYIKERIMPSIFKYGALEAKKFSSIIVNDAIDKYITEKVEVDNLFIVSTNSEGEITSIDFNTALINQYLTDTTKSIQKNLKYIENGDIQKVEYQADLLENYDKDTLKNGVIYYLNSGFIFNNPIFSNFGAQIPIKISLTGDVITNIATEVTNYGINNALIKVYVNIEIAEQVILPYYDKEIKIENKVPIALKLVTGTVPSYYGNLNTATPSLTLPNS